MQDQRYRKVWKLRDRLGVSANLTILIALWHKPKGMHWRTWERLRAQEAAVHAAITTGLAAWLARFVRQG